MKPINRVILIFVATGLGITGAWAQHDEHHSADAPQLETPKPEKAPAMGANMMAEMPKMMARHAEIKKLVDQLAASFAAIQSEKNQTALEKQLDAHAAVLKQLQTKLEGHTHMMDMMTSMMGDATGNKTPDKTETPTEHQH